mmetsp:Transcript_713/g.1571  ORF Transcript_713/g.1571 Transcript_713/m.1571 type:complete len:224 (+) Transcript_713:66-737(+)
MGTFPPELDEYLDRCAFMHNFDFRAISSDLVGSAAMLLRHPFADEPDELVRARASEVFSPDALQARWESRHGAWEVVASKDWELVDEQDVLSDDLEEDVQHMASYCVVHESRQAELPAEELRAKGGEEGSEGPGLSEESVLSTADARSEVKAALALEPELAKVFGLQGLAWGMPEVRSSIGNATCESDDDTTNSEVEFLTSARRRARIAGGIATVGTKIGRRR